MIGRDGLRRCVIRYTERYAASDSVPRHGGAATLGAGRMGRGEPSDARVRTASDKG